MRNRIRLSEPEYRSPGLFREGGDWPGDWQGRTMLALGCLHSALGGTAAGANVLSQLQAIVQALPEHTNPDGYFGDRFDGKFVNEQQVSGNSWYLRGLCVYYGITNDARTLELLNRIAERYLCKLEPFYAEYPLVKREEGGVGGHLQAAITDRWRLSSDVGCAFILLDGITHTYEVTRNPRLPAVIETMIAKFADIDYVAQNCQTHAVLSGTRGVLRYYRLTGDPGLLALAERNFRLYCECGMTVNYANYNWFGKPLWTEPCAVVDSILTAQQLFAETHDTQYLRFVNRAFRNAIRMAQRPNGGAGCDTCLTPENHVLKNHLYEAFFCCSMRLVEGLAALSDFLFLEEEGGLLLPLAGSAVYCSQSGGVRVEERVEEKPESWTISLRVTCPNKLALRLYLPANCLVETDCPHRVEEDLLCLEVSSGSYEVRLRFREYEEERQGVTVRMLGDTLLVRKNNASDYGPVCNCLNMKDREEVERTVQRI